MAEGDIWISDVLTNSSLVVGLDIDRSEPAWQAISRKEKPQGNELPVRLYAKYKDQKFDKPLPDLFLGGAGTQVSQRLGAVIEQYNAGSAWILPAQVMSYDRQAPLGPPCSIFTFPEKKDLLVPEECKGLRGRMKTRHGPKSHSNDVWGMPWELKDNDISLAVKDLEGIDIWSEMRLRNSLFFSDPLKEAICKDGFFDLFQFRKCCLPTLH